MAGLGNRFDFSRPNAAPYRNRRGIMVTAPIDGARFDHSEAGVPLGLMVEIGSELGQADRVFLNSSVMVAGPATVLHQVLRPHGLLERRAVYTLNANLTIDRCLMQVGRHQVIAVLVGHASPRLGRVRARRQWWTLASVLVDGGGAAIATTAGLPLLEG